MWGVGAERRRLYYSQAAKGGWNIPSWGKWSAPGPDHIGKEEGHTRDVQIRLDCIKVHEEDMLIWAVPC